MAETLESDASMPASAEPVNGGGGAPASPSSSSSSSSSDDSESDSQTQQILQLKTLESELSNNPSNYDAHVQYIKCLRKQGDIEKLHGAREAMRELFPLTPLMWQEWAKDETSLASSGPESYHAIENLYEQGVSDYLSVSLWCDYLDFIQEYDPSVRECSCEGILKARNLFERAVTAAGLHIVEGSKIWEAYREFEQAILLTVDETDVEAKEKQIQCIRSIFHRQLSVPIADMRATLLAYKVWEVEQGNNIDADSDSLDGIASQVASTYQKALEMYNARAHFEEQIAGQVASDADKIQCFMTYLKYEESSGDPARVQILYERAIADFPISSDIWMEYTRYMDRTLKVGNVVMDVYSRATRNCPWVGELWVRYLLSLERGHASEKEISAVFEKSLQCTFSSFEEYLDLFLTRIDGLRRRISVVGGESLDYALIRDTFQHASDYLSSHLKNTDRLLHLYAYWARLELDLGKDLAAARGVWESLCKISGSMLEAWKSYIEMETKLGHINEARSIYRRCYTKRFMEMGSEDICHSWLRFEREYGSLEDFDHAVRKVTPRLVELQLFTLQQVTKGVAVSTDQRGHSVKENLQDKRKPTSNLTDEQPTKKRQKNAAQNAKNVPRKVKSQAQDAVKANEAEGIKTKVDKAASTSGHQKEDSAPKKSKLYTDKCTAFLSNLSLQAKFTDVQNFFSDVGGVVDIRILNDKFTGKSRGLAYVEFSDEAHLSAAVAMNRQVLLGRKVSIARSDPSRGRNKGSTGHGSSIEHDKKGGYSRDQRGPDSRRTVERAESPVREDDKVQLKGKKAFALPGSANTPRTEEEVNGKPKSNDEFRNIFLKK